MQTNNSNIIIDETVLRMYDVCVCVCFMQMSRVQIPLRGDVSSMFWLQRRKSGATLLV